MEDTCQVSGEIKRCLPASDIAPIQHLQITILSYSHLAQTQNIKIASSVLSTSFTNTFSQYLINIFYY